MSNTFSFIPAINACATNITFHLAHKRLDDFIKPLYKVVLHETIMPLCEVQTIHKGQYQDLPRVRQSAIISALKNELTQSQAELADMAGEFKAGYPPFDNPTLKVKELQKHLEREVQEEVNAIKSAYKAAKTVRVSSAGGWSSRSRQP